MQQQYYNTSGDVYNMGIGGGGGGGGGGAGGSTLTFPEISQILPWNLPQTVHAFNPTHFSTRDHDPFLLSHHQPPPSSYGGLFNRRQPAGLQFGYDGGSPEHNHQLRLISEVVHPMNSAAPFGLHAELQKMTAQEIMDAKAAAASKSHSEAERRRRERINNHLAKLRSLLPSTTKTDKASLLAEVIQHVKELKRQTSLIEETSPVPTETDELTVDDASNGGGDGKWVVKASICCEDRPDLLPELIKTLKAMRLRTLRAEITTLGGRVKNVLFITAEEEFNNYNNNNNNDDVDDDVAEENGREEYSIRSIEEALRAVMEKSAGNGDDQSGSASVKRQRTNTNILEYRI